MLSFLNALGDLIQSIMMISSIYLLNSCVLKDLFICYCLLRAYYYQDLCFQFLNTLITDKQEITDVTQSMKEKRSLIKAIYNHVNS